MTALRPTSTTPSAVDAAALSRTMPHDNYEGFSKGLLREIACCLPITYETFTGDYTGATYSSVRMATSEAQPIIHYRRDNIAAPYLGPSPSPAPHRGLRRPRVGGREWGFEGP